MGAKKNEGDVPVPEEPQAKKVKMMGIKCECGLCKAKSSSDKPWALYATPNPKKPNEKVPADGKCAGCFKLWKCGFFYMSWE